MFRKLKIYAGSEHPHTAQQPQLIEAFAQARKSKAEKD
jgi:ribosomal protein L13